MKVMKLWSLTLVAIMAITSCSSRAEETLGCVKQLLPCLRYLNYNGTQDPPNTCCNLLKSVIDDSPECLCSLITNRGVAEAQRVGINTDQAQLLPAKCGHRVNPIACLTGESSGVAVFAPSMNMLWSFTLVAIFHLLGMTLLN